MAKYNIPNLYIANRDRANAGGGSDPQLESRVEALETTVDGTGGLIDQVDDLDEQINGDSTATPPVPGIVDEIEALEVSVFGDTTTTPATPGLVDRVEDIELAINGDLEAVPPILPTVGRIDYEIIDGTIDSIGANAKKTISLSPTIPSGKKVVGWSMYAVDSDLQTYMQCYNGDYSLCVKNIGSNAMTNKDYRVVLIYEY